jgi:mediator of RNA polymerase II transcription subunit 23
MHTVCNLFCRILERIGARALSAHLRKFCDYLVFEFANSGGGQHGNKCVVALNDMIWQYNIVTIDRLVLCLVSIPDFQLCILSEYCLPFIV